MEMAAVKIIKQQSLYYEHNLYEKHYSLRDAILLSNCGFSFILEAKDVSGRVIYMK
jgi:hypothetical protein